MNLRNMFLLMILCMGLSAKKLTNDQLVFADDANAGGINLGNLKLWEKEI